MSAVEFLDSNVLIYAYDPVDPVKQETARALVRGAPAQLCVSVQVLAEFSSILLHKLSPKALPAAVLGALQDLSEIQVVPTDGGIVRRAVEAHATYGIHFYDGMIVAAAERAGCSRIWSEDLNPGQSYFGIPVENPFAAS